VIAFLRKHMTREAVIGSVKRTDHWTFPVVAVREAIMNGLSVQITPSAALLFALPCLTTVWRSKILACSRSDSQSKTSKRVFLNSATAFWAESFRSWG
jgi:hypothetical protein